MTLYLVDYLVDNRRNTSERKTCMVREHHVAVLSANYVSVFYMRLTTNIIFSYKIHLHN